MPATVIFATGSAPCGVVIHAATWCDPAWYSTTDAIATAAGSSSFVFMVGITR
jgi:hypothetical protein